MTFKKLVILISEIKNEDELLEAYGKVDIAFQKEKITWNDHECLFSILSKIKF